jgi:hypothetical protein
MLVECFWSSATNVESIYGPSPFVIGATHQYTLQDLNGVVRRCELLDLLT